MQLYRYDDTQKFRHRVQDYLLQHEAEHNLLLGLLHNLARYPERYLEVPYLATVESNNEIQAVAIGTPPYKLTLSKAVDLRALKVIAADLAQDLQSSLNCPHGVNGLVMEVEAFLQAWQTLTGQPYRRVMNMRIYQLTQVEPVATATGHLRLATEADRPLLLEWFTAFADEIGEVAGDAPGDMINRGLMRQSVHLWEDGVPVSWASGSQSLPTAARIGPVYTPQQYRRKGYATACVAALSQKLLNEGCDRCFLFTDLANSISNHIYQQIGYRPICDWHDYAFV
jgi:hypothetical protein